MSLTLQLNHFNTIAATLDDNARLCMASPEGFHGYDFNVREGAASQGIMFRGSSGQAAENNRVRTCLVNALLTQFNKKTVMELPQSVRSALKVGFFKDDLKIDAEGKVTSGRPLTARRIRAVIAAVKEELSAPKGCKLAWEHYVAGCRTEKPKREVFDGCVRHANAVPQAWLAPLEKDCTAKKLFALLRQICVADGWIANDPQLAEHVEGGDGIFSQAIFMDVLVGRMSSRARENLLEFFDSDDGRSLLAHIGDHLDDPSTRAGFRAYERINSYMLVLADSLADHMGVPHIQYEGAPEPTGAAAKALNILLDECNAMPEGPAD